MCVISNIYDMFYDGDVLCVSIRCDRDSADL